MTNWNVGEWIMLFIDGGFVLFFIYVWIRGILEDPKPYLYAFKRNDVPGDMP
jgi:hypothetical protein